MSDGPLQFRDPARGRALTEKLHAEAARLPAPITLMHVCGSHEQAIARFGLRALLPERVDLVMGPGCPVCITDAPEVDEAIAIAERGIPVLTYGDMLRVPGRGKSLAEARAAGAPVEVIYSAADAVAKARATDGPVVFFATGFETTAVATAALLRHQPPDNFLVLSAHKYVPPAMEAVAQMPDSRITGFLAAGHAATITGWGLFEPFVERYRLPVVVGGFEPLDILAALVELVHLVREGKAEVRNAFPRCVTREGNAVALAQLWEVFEPVLGIWRGIAAIDGGNLRLRPAFARWDARGRLGVSVPADVESEGLAARCRCGDIMSGRATPHDCALFGKECVPDMPVGACMVSSEGTCRIWHQYGGEVRRNTGVALPVVGA